MASKGVSTGLPLVTRNGRAYVGLRDYGQDILPFQMQIYAVSGHGKGLAEEFFIEWWKRSTKGIVIYLADPKDEAEGSFVMYKPDKRYHLEQIKMDGANPSKYKCKLYHPFTFNIPKSYLPDINFFTLSIKDMTKEMWSILSESSGESETIKLFDRVRKSLGRNEGLYQYLHQIEKMVEGKKKGRKAYRDPKNFYLKTTAGTMKSLTEASNVASIFDNNYFLRRDSCPYKLDWKEVLSDNESYHVFLSMWLKDEKLKSFMVLALLQMIIENRQYAKKPILLVIPEVGKLVPRSATNNPQGYKYYLADAIREALITMRSKGKGFSSITDSQNWSETDDKVKGSATVTLMGQLSTKDLEVFCKSQQYKRKDRDKLMNLGGRNRYMMHGSEEYGIFRAFLPTHMHREPGYDWIETYKKHHYDSMKRYHELVAEMRQEISQEIEEMRLLAEYEEEKEQKEKEEKEKAKASKDTKKTKKKEETSEKDRERLMRLCYEMRNDPTLTTREKSYRRIANKYELHHSTVKKYIHEYIRKREEDRTIDIDSLSPMIGDGVTQEEVNSNYNMDSLDQNKP